MGPATSPFGQSGMAVEPPFLERPKELLLGDREESHCRRYLPHIAHDVRFFGQFQDEPYRLSSLTFLYKRRQEGLQTDVKVSCMPILGLLNLDLCLRSAELDEFAAPRSKVEAMKEAKRGLGRGFGRWKLWMRVLTLRQVAPTTND